VTAPFLHALGFLARTIACVLWFAGWVNTARSEDEFENAPISYYESESHDPVAKLLQQIKSGEKVLVADSKGDYLPSVLQALDIPVSSQCLVFSKTSLQLSRIGPSTPRAIYFNDSVYLGVVQGSDVMELTAIDSQLGCVFYTLEREREKFQILRDRGQCLSCHATSRTERVPGVLVRSIYSDKSGRPRSGSTSYVTDYRSPFQQRWGGWYVTGTHGKMTHLGNAFALDRQDPQKVDTEFSLNLEKLPENVQGDFYLQESSDIVALMVLEHQTRLHNLITRANYETRQAIYLDQAMNEALDRDKSFRTESTGRRIASVGEALVAGLLFADEFALESEVKGTSAFPQEFSQRGPIDSQGRSLYQLDLKKRLMRYPCSYLILSSHFDGLPDAVMTYIQNRMHGILTANGELPKGVRIEPDERKIIREMLDELKPGWLLLLDHENYHVEPRK
jgi:hypothetical protein